MGCCIFQNKNPIYFASKCLSDAKTSFAQIEKDMLAIYFACTKFHSLIYGRKVNVFTEYQPLVTIMLKELNKIPNNRLKRLRLKCLLYDIDVHYLPGKLMYVADLLSRNYIKKSNIGEEIILVVVHDINELYIDFKNIKETEFIDETRKDKVLNLILKYCKERPV